MSVETGSSYEHRWEEPDRRRKKSNDRAGNRDAASTAGYYGIPPVHKPHWRWHITAYFFLGGISGASYAIGAIALLAGGKNQRDLIRACRYLSLLTLIPGAMLLIWDLGRPRKFLNMFRVIKLRSPMPLGSWGLGVFGAFATLMAALQAAEDGLLGTGLLARGLLKTPGRLVAVLGTLPAFFVSGYTGVLLGATAVPLWAKNALLLGPLFIAASMASACAAVRLALLGKRPQSQPAHGLERLETLSAVVELSLLAAITARSRGLLGPVLAGRGGTLPIAGVLTGILAPLAGAAIPRGGPRVLAAIESALVLGGGYLLRHLIVESGKRSADDPAATFSTTRASDRER